MVIRRLVTDVLNADPAIEVAGIAANGRLALERIKQIKPDLVTMDVEMPEMNGVEVVRELRKTNPKLPVIMFSTLTRAAQRRRWMPLSPAPAIICHQARQRRQRHRRDGAGAR